MPPQANVFAKKAAAGKRVVRIDGLTQVRAALQSWPEALRAEVADAFDIGSRIILTEAAGRVPERTGKLKSSLGRNVREDGLQAAVGSSDYKAKFVEFGTEDTPAQPFLWPAFKLGARFVRGQSKQWVAEAGKKITVRAKSSKTAKAKLALAKTRGA